MKKAVFSIVILLVAAIGLSGCGSSGESSGSKIVTVTGTEPQRPLIPSDTNETGGGKIQDAIFAKLVSYDEKGKMHYEVAQSIETTDGGQNYVVKIRPNLKFSNDEPINADSFVEAWKFASKKSNAQLNVSWFEDIVGFSYDSDTDLSGVQKIDELTFSIALSQKIADYPIRLGYTVFAPLPKVAFEDMKAFGENPIGNGPYMLKEKGAWKHNEKIDLVVNPKYDGRMKPKNEGLTFIFHSNADAAYAELLAGNLDVLDQVPNAALTTYESDLDSRFISKPVAVINSFSTSDGMPGFEGEEGTLRLKAMSHAINREEITKVILHGSATPAKDYTSPVIEGYKENLPGSEVLKFDEAKAKELWAEAEKIKPYTEKFALSYNTDSGSKPWVEAVLNTFKNTFGIEAEAKAYPTKAEFRGLITSGQMQGGYYTRWQGDYPGAYNFLHPNYGTGGSANDSKFSNSKFDEILKKAAGATDTTEANELFWKAEEELFTVFPEVPLWYTNAIAGYSKFVSNVQISWDSVPLYYLIEKK